MGFRPTSLFRWSDQCTAQFRSKFVLYCLLHYRERVASYVKDVAFFYFESHEGKNLSDTAGGLGKQAYDRVVGRTSIVEDGLGEAGDGDDPLARIVEQVIAKIRSGLTYDGDRVGDFVFFQ